MTNSRVATERTRRIGIIFGGLSPSAPPRVELPQGVEPSGMPQPPPYRGASRVVTNHLPRIPTLLRAWRRADRRIAVNAS